MLVFVLLVKFILIVPNRDNNNDNNSRRLILITYNNRGDCATCQVFIAGRATRACIGKVPPEPKLKSLQEKGLEVRP